MSEAGGDLWTCKECGTESDYYETVKKLDPRPGVRRVICGDCYDALTEPIRTGPYTSQTPSGIGHKGGDSADMAALLSGSRAAKARAALLAVMTEPLTPEQASRKANLDPDYGSPRVSELRTSGLVKRVDGKGRSDRNNKCGRYMATEAGRALVERAA